MRGRSRTVAAALASVAACACGLALAAPAQAANFIVDDLDDAPDETPSGVCDAPGADTCTLRAALDEANSASGGDTITIAPPGQIDLTIATLSVFPDTAETITVNGHPSGTTIDSDTADRLVTVNGSGSTVLNDLSLIGGNAPVDNDGGGVVVVGGSLTLNRVNVTGNTVNSASGGAAGGGISTFSGTSLTLNDSSVSGNTITGLSGIGGGIVARGQLEITDSTISGNSTTLDAGGRGGGIDLIPSAATTIELVNSTISGNSAGGGGGGGIFTSIDGTLQIVGSTIAGNSTTGAGGGVRAFSNGTAENSIFAANTAGTNPDCSAAFSSAENSIESGTSCGFGTANGNQENVTPTQLALGALANNGGPTQTRALGAGSVALNAASGDCGGLTTDQRGVARPQGASCDIGAFELVPATQPPSNPPTTQTPIVNQTPTAPVATTPKCKKGQKLKKGRCVKKKRKKK